MDIENKKEKKPVFLFDKKKLVISVVIIILLFACYTIYLINKQDIKNIKFEDLKVEKNLSKDKNVGDLKIKNISFQKRGKLTVLRFDVNNDTDIDHVAMPNSYLVFLDKKGKTTYKTNIFISEIKAKDKMSFEFVINKKRIKDYTFLISEN